MSAHTVIDTRHIVCPHCLATNRVPPARRADDARCGKCHRALFEGHPVSADAGRFNKHRRGDDIPLLVDVWAPWCGPCKMIAPILDEIAPEFAGKAKIVKINVDDNQLVAGQFGIRSIPTLLLFKNGQLVATQVGALPKNQLAAFINQHL